MFDKAEMSNIEDKKSRILQVLNLKGPSLPIQVSKDIGISTLLASAIIAEMRDNNILRVSNIKVGGSPLYFIAGQEAMLDNFSKFLPQKERETLELLKKSQVLEDEKVTPAERVALRSIKDFAFPIKAEGEKIFWRFHTFPEEDARKMINGILKSSKIQSQEIKEETKSELKIEKIEKKRKLRRKKDKTAFLEKIMSCLEKKNVKIEKINEDNDFSAIVSVNSDVGMVKFLAIAKDKKKISKMDILLAQQQAQNLGLPLLCLVNETPKSAEDIMRLVIFSKID